MNPSAPFPGQRLEWDSAFFGFPIAQVTADQLTDVQVSEIDQWCTDGGIRCLYLLTSFDDPLTTMLVQRHDFQLVDMRILLEWEERNGLPAYGERGSSIVIRDAQADDIPALERIASDSHHDSRFYFDPAFSRARCDALYATWIRNSFAGFADVVLVADHAGTPVGYISCHIDKDGAGGKIGLLGVAHHMQGQGIGGMLIHHAQEWFLEHDVHRISVVTQARNATAQRLYQRFRFLTRDTHLWYHKWYSGG